MPHSFPFIGGSPALDFVNTEVVVHGERTDLLKSESDLLEWLDKAGLLAAEGLRDLRQEFPTRREAWLSEATSLRRSLRRMFLHLAGGGTIRPSHITPVRNFLAGTEGTLRLSLQGTQPQVEFIPKGVPSPAGIVARAAAEFLASADLSLVRRCEGTGCILLFYDTTKSHTRRWCSMASCGNRMKAAAHYHRHRGKAPE